MIALYIKDYAVDGTEEKDIGHTVAYAMLDTLYRAKFNTPTPVTLKNEYGKPYFADGSCHFSISHGKGLCAVLLTDEGECGVDIEPEIEETRARKIDTRYLSDGLPVHPINGVVELKTELPCQAKTNLSGQAKTDLSGHLQTVREIEIQPVEAKSFDEMPTTAKWTFLEAVLKMSGEGFAAFSKRLEIAAVAGTKTLFVGGGKNSFFVTVAVKNK